MYHYYRQSENEESKNRGRYKTNMLKGKVQVVDLKWCFRVVVTRNAMVFFRWMPNLLDIHMIQVCQFFDNFETCFLCKLELGLSASVKLQHKWQTCKVRKCLLAVLKNIQFPDLWSIRPTGQVRKGKLTLWLGSFKNTNVWDISKRNVHHTIVMKYLSHFLRLVSFFRCQ